jgi:hypothetical protein
VGLRDLMLGLVVVGVVVGIIVGRSTERARRTYKDWDTAKTALKKGRAVALTELRRAAITVLIIVLVLVALFVGALHAPH